MRTNGVVATVARWTTGVVLVSWRYLWAITPLHRGTEPGTASDYPPPLPPPLVDRRSQPLAHGVGPLYHRIFTVRVEGSHLNGPELIQRIAADLNKAIPREVTAVEPLGSGRSAMDVGNEFVVRMPGPWDGPVRVVHRDETSLRLATLGGHMEAGQIEFSARSSGDHLHFQIETWARPGNRLVHLLHTHLWLASEIQLNMWVRFCLATVKLCGGRARHGVTIQTRFIDPGALLSACINAEGTSEPRPAGRS